MEVVQKGISSKKLRNILIAVVVGLVLVFGILYYINRDLVSVVNNSLPINSEPSFIYSIYGSGLDGGLKKPMGVTVANDKIYVTDTGNGRVQIFDYDGKPIKKFGTKGDKEGQFKFPYGIAVDKNGNIYVADFYTHKVSIFDENGKFKRYFGNPEKDYSGPGAIAIEGQRLYMADINNANVKIFDLSGKKIKEFGKKGQGKGEFASPNYLTVNNGKIYVSEAKNQRVQVFDTNGKYQLTFEEGPSTTKDKSNSYLVNPRGIGIDGKGQVYVASTITSKIHIYNRNGKHIGAFGELGNEDQQFNLPNGLYVDYQGRIYITDTANERIDVYQN